LITVNRQTPGSAEARFRPARKQDCAKIAALYRISSDGVADYIWTKLAAPGEDILDVGRRRYEREGTAFSYQNCTIAEIRGEVAGMLVAFPMRVDPSHVETDPVLAPYSKLEEDDRRRTRAQSGCTSAWVTRKSTASRCTRTR
jgi:hypothetical protein